MIALTQSPLEMDRAVGYGFMFPGSSGQPVVGRSAIVYYKPLCYKLIGCSGKVVDMPRPATPFDLDDLARAYLAGEPLEPLAIRMRIGQGRLKQAFLEAGIPLRDRSEAMRHRWRGLDGQGRVALLAAAHEAARGRKAPEEEIAKRLLTRSRTQQAQKTFVGSFEGDLIHLLRRRGLRPIHQQAVVTYNLDIGLPPIAVEVHVAANNPLTDSRKRKRTMDLCGWGWSIVYVWITARHPLRGSAADEIVAFYQTAQRGPASCGKCWVIRGTGEAVPIRLHRDQLAGILPPES